MIKYLYAALLFLLLPGCGTTEEKLIRKAERLHKKILTVDTHCDTPMSLVSFGYDMGEKHDKGCVDFPRMKEGGLDAEFFAVYIEQKRRNDTTYREAYDETLKILDAIHKNVEKNKNLAEIALSPSDALRIKSEGRIAAFIGIENGFPAGKEIGRIKEFYDLGARYITLCHSNNNDICDSSTDPGGAEHKGLSDFGTEVVKEMNRVGMMVDVSHISDEAFYDVIRESKAPVIASHSSCRALCSSPRNLSDEMLLSLKKNNGVIQICILSSYIKTPEPNPELEAKMKELREKYGDPGKLSEDQRKAMREERWDIWNKYRKLATVPDVVDHIDHVVQVVGIDHVGIGTDFDGGGGVDGCRTVAEMKNITIELLRRGYNNDEIKKIWGGNIMRVFTDVRKIAGVNI